MLLHFYLRYRAKVIVFEVQVLAHTYFFYPGLRSMKTRSPTAITVDLVWIKVRRSPIRRIEMNICDVDFAFLLTMEKRTFFLFSMYFRSLCGFGPDDNTRSPKPLSRFLIKSKRGWRLMWHMRNHEGHRRLPVEDRRKSKATIGSPTL